MSISTARGDDGTTEIWGGERLPKDHPRIESLGALDELNAFLGDARCTARRSRTRKIIQSIQAELSTLMGILARAGGEVPGDGPLTALVAELEQTLPPRGFVTPGTCPGSAKLDIARTVCRRAERRLLTLDRREPLEAGIKKYINRLADLLFMLARYEETEE